MDYTPREIKGWLYFVSRQEKRDDKHQLALMASATRGDPKELKKTLTKKDPD